MHPTFSSAASRILQYSWCSHTVDSTPAPDALRCGPPVAPFRLPPRGAGVVFRAGFGGSASSFHDPWKECGSSSGFLAALSASVLPREAHGAFSGLVSFFSHPVDCSALLPEGCSPGVRRPKVVSAAVPGLPSNLPPSPVSVWSEAIAP